MKRYKVLQRCMCDVCIENKHRLNGECHQAECLALEMLIARPVNLCVTL